jgi:hypothetical protein
MVESTLLLFLSEWSGVHRELNVLRTDQAVRLEGALGTLLAIEDYFAMRVGAAAGLLGMRPQGERRQAFVPAFHHAAPL